MESRLFLAGGLGCLSSNYSQYGCYSTDCLECVLKEVQKHPEKAIAIVMGIGYSGCGLHTGYQMINAYSKIIKSEKYPEISNIPVIIYPILTKREIQDYFRARQVDLDSFLRPIDRIFSIEEDELMDSFIKGLIKN